MKTTRMKSKMLAGIFLLTACFPIQAATQAEINESVTRGLAWLATQQDANGSWLGQWGVSYYSIGTTALAVNSFTHHAKQQGLDPFSADYVYSPQVNSGLHYIFAHTHRNIAAGEVSWGDHYMYAVGPALMAITSSGQKDRVVNQPGSAVDGMTYEQIALEILQFLDRAQTKSGHGVGSWYYSANSTTGDMSIAGWIALGMGYAATNFDIILDQDVLDLMSAGIDLAQWTQDPNDIRYGGVGYTSSSQPQWSYTSWINLYKAGHLLYMMELCGDDLNTPRVQRTLTFIQNAWDYPNSGRSGYDTTVNGFPDMGWKGGPWMGPGNPAPNPLPSYIATVSMMKGFVLWGVDHLGGTIDWYGEMTDVIVAMQNEDGSWDQGGYPSGDPELSTVWALLTTQRAVPASGSISNITFTSAVFHASAPEEGTGYYVVVPRGDPQPSTEQILNGHNAADQPAVAHGSGPMQAESETDYMLTNLQPGTRYDLYFVHVPGEEGPPSAVLRVQFATLNLGNMLNVTAAMNMSAVSWRVDHASGALVATYRIRYNEAHALKQDLHTAFWVAIPSHPDWKLHTVDGTTPDGLPYTDVTQKVENRLQQKYQRLVMQPGDEIQIDVAIYSRDRTVPPIESLHAFWADPPFHPADLNRDGIIDDFEMLMAVDEWDAGRMGDFDLIRVIEMWRESQ